MTNENNVINVDFKNKIVSKPARTPRSYNVKYLPLATIQFKSMADLQSFMSKHFPSLSEKIAERTNAVPSFGYIHADLFYVCVSAEIEKMNGEIFASIRGMIQSSAERYNGRLMDEDEDMV